MSMPDLEQVAGAMLPEAETVNDSIRDLFFKAIENDIIDAILIPHETPDGDSFAYILARDAELIKTGVPLPPIMPISGGRVLMSLCKNGGGTLRIAAIMRPCEIRSAIELSKLRQVDLERLLLITMDCPGAIPLSSWFADQATARERFDALDENPDNEHLRPICRICDNADITNPDLHIGTRGLQAGSASLIACSEHGEQFLESMGMNVTADLKSWRGKTRELKSDRIEKRKIKFAELREDYAGINGLSNALRGCIGCRICRDVCPLCICRECYFDCLTIQRTPEEYLRRADEAGFLRFPPGNALFHIGRMTHMSFQCVSCGACEDACPVGLPVAQLFSMVGEETSSVFEYLPGMDREAEIPLNTYRENELEELDGSREEVAS